MNLNIPADYDRINVYNSQMSPSTVHCSNTELVEYYKRYLLQKVISVYDFQGFPKIWSKSYFTYVLFGIGYITVFETDRYGVIPQACGLSGYNVFYEPTNAIVANPLIEFKNDLRFGYNCELVKMQPDYSGIMDMVTNYADLMALAWETASVNLVNSKMAYVFASSNKAGAETFKKMYDQINQGNPAVFIDKDMFNLDGSRNWDYVTQNIGANYIVGDILADLKNIEDRFNTDIGIPNANTQKRERLITDEVNANNVDTKAKVILWLETIREGLEKVNEMFGLNLSVKYRYDLDEILDPEEGVENGINEY